MLGHPETAGGDTLVAARLLERLGEHAALEVLDQLGQALRATEPERGPALLEVARWRNRAEGPAGVHRQHPLDVVLQLADVSRPVALHERGEELGRQLGDVALLLLREVGHEVVGEGGDIGLALA